MITLRKLQREFPTVDWEVADSDNMPAEQGWYEGTRGMIRIDMFRGIVSVCIGDREIAHGLGVTTAEGVREVLTGAERVIDRIRASVVGARDERVRMSPDERKRAEVER